MFTRETNIWGYSASAVFSGEPYRLVTYMFAHGSLRHLIGNMIALVIVGSTINKNEGNLHFLIIYFGGGILAALLNSIYALYSATNVTVVTVGASGAVFALLGALLVEAFLNYDMEANKADIIIYVIIVMLTSNIGGNVSVGTHIFGFIAGVILGVICCKETLRRHAISAEKFSEKEKYYEKKYESADSSYAGPSSISRM